MRSTASARSSSSQSSPCSPRFFTSDSFPPETKPMKRRQRLRLCSRIAAGAIFGLPGASVAPLGALSPAEWRYQQTLEIPASGLVRVDLPPATLNAARPGLDNLRVIDAKGAEVPFLIEQPAQQPGVRQRA